MDRKTSSHLPLPVLGSNRVQKTFRDFLEDLPAHVGNKAFYNAWSMDAAQDQNVVASDTAATGATWGTGSAANEPDDIVRNAEGGLDLVTSGADNDEGIWFWGAHALFTPEVDAPITFLFEAEIADVSTSHFYIGLGSLNTTVDAACMLAANTGALTALAGVDKLGFHSVSGGTPDAVAQDGAGSADTAALTGLTLADATPFRFAMEIRSAGVRYYGSDGTNVVDSYLTLTNTTLTSLGLLAPIISIQNHGAGDSTLSMWRAFCSQRVRFTNAISDWR